MHWFYFIPHPSWQEMLVSLEIFVALYVPKRFLDKLLSSESKFIKRQIYKYHRRHHLDNVRICKEDDCRKLKPRNQLPSPADSAQLVSSFQLEL